MFNLLKHRGFFDELIIWQEFFFFLTDYFPAFERGNLPAGVLPPAQSALIFHPLLFPSSSFYRALTSTPPPSLPDILIPIWYPSFQKKQVVRAGRVFSAGPDTLRKVFSFFPVNMMMKLSSISCSSVTSHPLWRWREVSYLSDAERKTADKRSAHCCCLTWALRTVWEMSSWHTLGDSQLTALHQTAAGQQSHIQQCLLVASGSRA